MKKRNLQKQIIAAILTGTIAVNACPVAVMAAEIIPEEAEITQQSEETTETAFTEAPETETPETETQALFVQAESLDSGERCVDVTQHGRDHEHCGGGCKEAGAGTLLSVQTKKHVR